MPSIAVAYHQRAVVGATVSLTYEHRDQHGDRAEAGGTPTVEVTSIRTGTTVTVGSVVTPEADETPVYTAVVAATENTLLDEWSVAWTVEGTVHTRAVAIIARPYFSLEEAEEAGFESFDNPARARMRKARIAAERECERITGRSFVRRFARWVAPATRGRCEDLLLPVANPRELIAVAELTSELAVDYAWSAAELGSVILHDGSGIAHRSNGSWPSTGLRIDLEHGFDLPPDDITEMVMRRYRYHLSKPTSAIPDRATSFSAGEGGTFRLSTPGPMRTGDLDVDSVYLSPEYHILPMAR